MWEFHLLNQQTKKEKIIFGHSLSDAFRRYDELSPDEWQCIGEYYVD